MLPGQEQLTIREIFNMAEKRRVVDSEALQFANLAILAEKVCNYEDAAQYWRKASESTQKTDAVVLYEEAAKRCERKSKGH